jgi:hypothetical protein
MKMFLKPAPLLAEVEAFAASCFCAQQLTPALFKRSSKKLCASAHILISFPRLRPIDYLCTMPIAGFELEDMERLIPSSARQAFSQAAKGMRRLPNKISEGMRKSLQLNSMNMATWQSFCIIAQIVCFIVEEELNFYFLFVDYDRKEGGDYRNDNVDWDQTPVMYVILALEILFTLATIASVHFAIQYHLVKKLQHIHITQISSLRPETKMTVFV